MSHYAYYDPYSNRTSVKPTNVMEHLQLLKWYGELKLATLRLELIARHIDDPQWIKDKEEEWLHEDQYWNGYYGQTKKEKASDPTSASYYGFGGEEWERE